MSAVIYAEKIYKSFGDHKIFEDYTFAVEEGEFVLIKGQSGCGKSTLLSMIGLLVSPDSGSIHIGNHVNVRPYTEKGRKILAEEIGWLFQNYALVDDKSVRANLSMVLNGLSKKKWIRELKRRLSKLGFSKQLIRRSVRFLEVSSKE